MFGLGAGELFLILVIALIFIGPKKLPELAKGLGKGLKEFNKAKNELVNSMNQPDEPEQVQNQTSGQISQSASTEEYKQSISGVDLKSGPYDNPPEKSNESNDTVETFGETEAETDVEADAKDELAQSEQSVPEESAKKKDSDIA